jgi:hypothetical protein
MICGTGSLVALTLAALSLTACSQPPSEPPGGLGSKPAEAEPAASTTAPSQAVPVSGRSPDTAPISGSTHPPSTAAAVSAAADCSEQRGWTTAPDDGGLAMSPAALYLVRAGRHACYDRVVFDVNGAYDVGFVARYVPVVTSDPRGDAVPVAGNAALEVVVRAPVTVDHGHQPLRREPAVGDALVVSETLHGWESLRAVRFAGSFEGESTIAVGVREQRPFRMWVIGDQGYRHVILDIAH